MSLIMVGSVVESIALNASRWAFSFPVMPVWPGIQMNRIFLSLSYLLKPGFFLDELCDISCFSP